MMSGLDGTIDSTIYDVKMRLIQRPKYWLGFCLPGKYQSVRGVTVSLIGQHRYYEYSYSWPVHL